MRRDPYYDKLRDRYAGQFAAAMISTIHNEADYQRARNLAIETCGDPEENPDNHGIVSEWIAWEAHKQAERLIAQLYPGYEEPPDA